MISSSKSRRRWPGSGLVTHHKVARQAAIAAQTLDDGEAGTAVAAAAAKAVRALLAVPEIMTVNGNVKPFWSARWRLSAVRKKKNKKNKRDDIVYTNKKTLFFQRPCLFALSLNPTPYHYQNKVCQCPAYDFLRRPPFIIIIVIKYA